MTDVAPTPSSITLALRFDPRDAELLDRLADRVQVKDILADVSTFRLAAEAARNREPLRFECETADEAKLIAAGYVMHGCRPPTIDDVRRG